MAGTKPGQDGINDEQPMTNINAGYILLASQRPAYLNSGAAFN